MEDGGGAFEAHAGVHAGLGKRCVVASLVAVVLHKHKVPDFDKATTVAGEFAVGVTGFRGGGTYVVVNFATRTTWACVAHGPKIVFGVQGENAPFRDALLQPIAACVVIGRHVGSGGLYRQLSVEDGDI